MAHAIIEGGNLTVDGVPTPISLSAVGDGSFTIDVGANLTLDPTNLALQSTSAAILAKIIAAPATAAGQASLQTAIGTISDAAWAGTGDGTVIAVLKAIAINTTTP